MERQAERYADGEARLPDEPDERQRQLTRMGNAAYGAGLSLLMAGDGDEAATWLARAAERYRESFAGAPPNSWGRPIGAIKARILAEEWEAAADEARLALEAGAAEAESPIGRYAAALACAALADWDDMRVHADVARTHDAFPEPAVADALAFIAAEDVVGYIDAVERVLESFEQRDAYLEDVPVADTVVVLEALARRRGFTAELESDLLPR